jgi:hypothetical protein
MLVRGSWRSGFLPRIERVCGEAQRLAGHRDKEPIGGEVEDRPKQIRRASRAESVGARLRISFSCSRNRSRSPARADTALMRPGRTQSPDLDQIQPPVHE